MAGGGDTFVAGRFTALPALFSLPADLAGGIGIAHVGEAARGP
jgi:hypothetical protein